MKIRAVTVGPFQENCYLVVDEASGAAVLVDPGDEPQAIVRMVRDAGVTPQGIWLTHGHLDHIGGIVGVKQVWDVPVHLHPADRPLFDRGAQQAAAYGVPFEQPGAPDVELAEGDELQLGESRFRVFHVPGHAPGHVAFIAERVMLSGDLLFAGSIGRTDLPLSNPAAMQASLDRIATLDDEVMVYPGHGPATSIGAERTTNPFLSGIARVARR